MHSSETPQPDSSVQLPTLQASRLGQASMLPCQQHQQQCLQPCPPAAAPPSPCSTCGSPLRLCLLALPALQAASARLDRCPPATLLSLMSCSQECTLRQVLQGCVVEHVHARASLLLSSSPTSLPTPSLVSSAAAAGQCDFVLSIGTCARCWLPVLCMHKSSIMAGLPDAEVQPASALCSVQVLASHIHLG